MHACGRGRHCLILTQRTSQLELLAKMLRDKGRDPVVLRGGMSAKARAAAFARLDPTTPDTPLLIVATESYIGEGFDCPALDTLFLTTPIAFKGRLVQYVGRTLRPHPGKTTAEVHDTKFRPEFSDHRSPREPLATPASASPTHAASGSGDKP